MSYANYGPDFRQQSVVTAFAGLTAPIVADNAAVEELALIQAAGGGEVPLVLGPGLWAIAARCAINPANAANTYQYVQTRLYAGGNVVATSAPIFGGAVLGAQNVELYLSLTYIISVPDGQTRSMTYRLSYNGTTAILGITDNYSQIVAHKLS